MPEQNPPAESSRPLDALEATILARQAAPDEKSYTAKLLAGGVEKIGGKILEEAAELVEAAGNIDQEGREHTIYEAGDLLYHTLVLLAASGIRLSEVEAELARRFGVSGLQEKASRGKNEQ
jgi:phosphoribosyl-ATP pyrophosphohydrolase